MVLLTTKSKEIKQKNTMDNKGYSFKNREN